MVELLEREGETAAIDAVLRSGGVLVVEGGAGVGKTSLLDAAARRATTDGRAVLWARGSELEAGFPFGVIRQLFERHLAALASAARRQAMAGPAAAARSVVAGEPPMTNDEGSTFSVIHGLYWLALNLASAAPLLLVVDDAHWADDRSLRWLAYLAVRLDGPDLAVLVALRPAEPAAHDIPLLAVRAGASAVVTPALLSDAAVAALVRSELGNDAAGRLAHTVHRLSGGNPLYVAELLRVLRDRADPDSRPGADVLPLVGHEDVAAQVLARVRRLDPAALTLAQALAVLGDNCELRHGAAVAGIEMPAAARLAAELLRLDVLDHDDPARFRHPVVEAAVEASLTGAGRHDAHRAAARVLDAAGAPASRVAAHLTRVRPAGDPWAVGRLLEAARAALELGAPEAAAALYERALTEPAPAGDRVTILRALALAEQHMGRASGCARLEEAIRASADPRQRAEIALQLARAHAGLFRWADAADVAERALGELGDWDADLYAELEGELVASGLQDARTAHRVLPVLGRIGTRDRHGPPAEVVAVAGGLAAAHTGRPADEAAGPLLAALAAAPVHPANWQARAALLWVLLVCDRYEEVAAALEPMTALARASGSSRALVTTQTTWGLLHLRRGALPEAEGAAHVALEVIQAGDFTEGLPFAAAVLADVAVEAGDLDEAQRLVDLMPDAIAVAGVAAVLIPAARGRLRLAQGRPADALAEFERCHALWSPEAWGLEIRDIGYLHWRAGAAAALTRLGESAAARELADAELADAREFGAFRPLGVSLRAAGLARGGGADGVDLLRQSVEVLRRSPALLERGHSLVELGAWLRRTGERRAAREPLREALEIAAGCGAGALADRARDELTMAGARPRRERRTGIESLTPGELRVARLAADGLSNRQIAQELYVALKTVEGHLARVYAKLGIPGRAQLAECLG